MLINNILTGYPCSTHTLPCVLNETEVLRKKKQHVLINLENYIQKSKVKNEKCVLQSNTDIAVGLGYLETQVRPFPSEVKEWHNMTAFYYNVRDGQVMAQATALDR